MGYVGVSLILGAVVFFIARPPRSFVDYLRSLWLATPQLPPSPSVDRGADEKRSSVDGSKVPFVKEAVSQRQSQLGGASVEKTESVSIPTPSITASEDTDEDDVATTPKASAAPATPAAHDPSFSLSSSDEDTTAPTAPAPPRQTPLAAPSLSTPDRPSAPGLMAPPPRPGAMAPPPRPGAIGPPAARSSLGAPQPPRLPPLTQPSPSASSLSRSTLPIPSRGPPGASSLAPPPTHTNGPAPSRSRLVALAPGHSPLDWARISGPNADLRNLPPSTPYLRVSPSMLKRRNGRKGADAWSVYSGRVYNVTPYLKFHPGGEGELLRGAGKDATKIFGEVHPWVNYETMLAACLVGVAVGEGDGSEDVKPGGEERVSAMEEMD
ncbi:hypothetical protein MCOR02_004138 [Pyricularia oryzae]|uniref:Cytochrome b5 heme-binding domain-containing protein n=1 Tax=Pyricularia oryzae TaxID=318829 RepID=A0A4P7MWU5_PYROR|nr:hypothetical protein MCOR02_004138 [Pyricularia oryzae]KAI6328123.1 hypothetical protein MCOR34_000270 [Pyricularia oryzae]KAI6445567.1 hypothetical protein MCOR17_010942 [Pyricularia oryzae]KAI6505725.1 hypothetical protein MCOR13_003944 [Pyricularia oryzae]KAI6579593.1 hypothetical protein MCOR04_005982 [Pyricularia oryzae]